MRAGSDQVRVPRWSLRGNDNTARMRVLYAHGWARYLNAAKMTRHYPPPHTHRPDASDNKRIPGVPQSFSGDLS